ncbi:hypothetical protein B296_00037481 [Ensete ventricosum]|uniref:40S ribosomal protein S14 n=1 Tax=Ensete ventricosum TaxID=4639 RepID=A0A426XX98_ENSVE|nr:hypothetical protein B296_00037481 [Ensete ventricosum]
MLFVTARRPRVRHTKVATARIAMHRSPARSRRLFVCLPTRGLRRTTPSLKEMASPPLSSSGSRDCGDGGRRGVGPGRPRERERQGRATEGRKRTPKRAGGYIRSDGVAVVLNNQAPAFRMRGNRLWYLPVMYPSLTSPWQRCEGDYLVSGLPENRSLEALSEKLHGAFACRPRSLSSMVWLIEVMDLQSGRKKTREPKEDNVTLGPAVREGEQVFGVAHIFASFNDTFIHVTDLSGRETLVRITGFL